MPAGVVGPIGAGLGRGAGAALATALVLALALAVAVWPVTLSLAVLVAGVVALAIRSPGWALAAGILLFGFEGSVKILLGFESPPLPGSDRAIGAAAIDVALFAAVAGAVAAGRGHALRALWSAMSRPERVAVSLLAAWLVVSFLQIAQGGDLERGLHGFRLFQAYVLVGVAAAALASHPRAAVPAAQAVLGVGLVVSLYAALRVAIGPAETEEAFALSLESVTAYGGEVRAIGSFSSAVGMGSYLMPIAVFALVVGFLLPRLRLFAWTVASLSVVGIVGSYGRAPLLGVLAGLLCMLAVLAVGRGVPRRRKLAAAATVVAVLAACYGGVYVASQGSPRLEERAAGILDPFGDRSIELRLEGWRDKLGDVAEKPLGRGTGTTGAASAVVRGKREGLVTTDNSFLKVLLEQGIPVTAVFVTALLALVALIGRRLSRLSGDRRAVGLAALCASVGFLVLATLGEAVEQPGKVVAWGLLGTAVALAARPCDQRVAE